MSGKGHGTVAMYESGCRCPECEKAYRYFARKRYRMRREQDSRRSEELAAERLERLMEVAYAPP